MAAPTCVYCGAAATCRPDPGYYGQGREDDFRCTPCSGDLSAVVPLGACPMPDAHAEHMAINGDCPWCGAYDKSRWLP